jgi:hypothetical protein
MKEIAEQFAAFDLIGLCADNEEGAKVKALSALSCEELKDMELQLTLSQLAAIENGGTIDQTDQLTLQALSLVCLSKYVSRELSFYRTYPTSPLAA